MALFVDIEKTLGNFHLQVSFTAEDEIFSLLGASGCGKSLTLKCIAGIERPDRGKIILDGVTLFDSDRGINLPPQQRRVGYLFQQYALFPNMTVRQNIRCGIRKADKQVSQDSHNQPTTKAPWLDQTVSTEAHIDAIIHAMNLDGLESLRPAQLSGGQQQRVALARILINEPDIVMLDEPFSALDAHLRFHLEREVHAVMQQFGRTVLLISHDRDEVFRMADRIAVMDAGRMQAVGTRHEVFADPRTVSGARLTGCKNVAPAVHLDDSHQLYVPAWGLTFLTDRDTREITHVGVRMHDIHLASQPATADSSDAEGTAGTDAVPGEGIAIDNKETIQVSFPTEREVHHSVQSGVTARCRVIEEIENPFSMTVMLQAPEGTEPFGMELDKAIWREQRSAEVDICIPEEAILLLRD